MRIATWRGQGMRGAVYHYDQDQDFGYINGVDGKRYMFARYDLNHGVALVRGTLVEFQPDDGTAHNIVAVASTTPSSGTGQPPEPSRFAEKRPAGSTGLWAYFRRTVSVNYFNFNGRARRKEFWAFWLCFILVQLALVGFGILVNLAINGFGINAGRSSIGFIPASYLHIGIRPVVDRACRAASSRHRPGWLACLDLLHPGHRRSGFSGLRTYTVSDGRKPLGAGAGRRQGLEGQSR
jgi:hypothetical protein